MSQMESQICALRKEAHARCPARPPPFPIPLADPATLADSWGSEIRSVFEGSENNKSSSLRASLWWPPLLRLQQPPCLGVAVVSERAPAVPLKHFSKVTLQVRGVNRHEHDDRRGKYVDRAGMVRDIVLMKQLNFNAVHIPRPPSLPFPLPVPLQREREREGEGERERRREMCMASIPTENSHFVGGFRK